MARLRAASKRVTEVEKTVKIWVAGRDRTDELGSELAAAAAGRPVTAVELDVARETELLDLRRAESESEYRQRFLDALRQRACVETDDFRIGVLSGPMRRALAAVRTWLWRLLRYQHDWTTFRQNGVNRQLAFGLEMEAEARERKVAELERRLAALEFEVRGPAEDGGDDDQTPPS